MQPVCILAKYKFTLLNLTQLLVTGFSEQHTYTYTKYTTHRLPDTPWHFGMEYKERMNYLILHSKDMTMKQGYHQSYTVIGQWRDVL